LRDNFGENFRKNRATKSIAAMKFCENQPALSVIGEIFQEIITVLAKLPPIFTSLRAHLLLSYTYFRENFRNLISSKYFHKNGPLV
jgi:hypothetical protein